jgi:hypothetical protein
MVQGLHKIIEKFILPQFPWIADYNIRVAPENGRKFVLIKYYVKSDEEGSFIVDESFKEVEDFTLNVFKMMGFDLDTFFEGVQFHSYRPNHP